MTDSDVSSYYHRVYIDLRSVSTDGQRLLLENCEKELHSRFVGKFRWDDVSLTAAAINEREHRRFVPLVRSSSAFREGTRARPRVAFAAFLLGRDIELVISNRHNERDGWRVERSGELLDEVSDTKRQFQHLAGGYSC